MMLVKKFLIVLVQLVVVTTLATANNCPKWLPMPMTDGLHAVIPIYNESITAPDLDCDEIVDSVDTDIDGDGISNTTETANGTNPLNPDSDGDGVSDGHDAFPLDASENTDTDGDGVGNNADPDDDGDGTDDIVEIASGTNPLDANSRPMPFKITVTTSNPGTSSDTSFTIPTYSAETYRYILKCEDTATSPVHLATGDYTCTYDTPGTYTILILDANGDGAGFPGIHFNNSGDKDKIVGINQWGTGKWKRMDGAFYGCSNLSSVGGEATDVPNLSQVSYLNYTFADASIFNQDIGGWDTSHVLDMSSMFSGATAFDQDIGGWDTSHVQVMSSMFNSATAFDKYIGGWDTHDVMDMSLMFYSARNFNQDIGDWNTSRVDNMQRMFNNARAFNQDIGDWDTSSVRDMDGLFAVATSFTNQDLSHWDVYKVYRHNFFFSGAGIGNIEPIWPHFMITVKTDNAGSSANNQFTIPTNPGEIYNYNVDCKNDGTDDVTGADGNYTCTYASAGTYTIVIKDNTEIKEGFPAIFFNNQGDKAKITGINQWGTGKWTTMSYAFQGCKNLNDEGGAATDTPDLSNVRSLIAMFSGASIFNQDIGDWDTSNVRYMNLMFGSAYAFNQDIGDWNTSNVRNMPVMFFNTHDFNQDIGGWDTSNVDSMNGIFAYAVLFNQDIGGWDTSNVEDMNGMLDHAYTFNQDISRWDTGNVGNMDKMFNHAENFTNHDLSGWDVHSVTSHTDFMTNAGAGNTEPIW